MVDFSSDDWTFELDGGHARLKEEARLTERLRKEAKFIGSKSQWDNYTDERLYEMDKLMRDFLRCKLENAEWCRTHWNRRMTQAMLWEALKGEKWTKEASGYTNALSKVATYYATRIQKEGYVLGKHRKRKVYTFGKKAVLNRRPLSLKLRLEEMAEAGELPTGRKMALVQETLTTGHARLKRVDDNMARRREAGRRAYERYRERLEAERRDREAQVREEEPGRAADVDSVDQVDRPGE